MTVVHGSLPPRTAIHRKGVPTRMKKNMRYNGKEEKLSLRERLTGMSVYARIFAVAALVLFVFGLCTLGAFNGTGKSVSVPASGQTVSMAYRLSYEEGQTLAAVYVNVGTVYAEPGAATLSGTLRLRAYYFNGTDWNNSIGSAAYVASIYADNSSSSYKSNANYNWLALSEGRNLSPEYIRISVIAGSASGKINEVAFVDGDGNLIDASVAVQYCDGFSSEEVARTLDAQGSFHASASNLYNFTYQEEYILASIDGIELGGETNDDNVYVMSSDYNSFGILVYALFTWIFGKSTFGLRLPSFLSAFGLFVLLFFFGKKLLRKDKWGLVFAGVFALGGGLFGLGRVGTPAALALFAVVLGIYFMYRFFSEGVSAARPAVSALPVLFSGIASAVAFAVSTMTGFASLVSLLLFVCGLLRLYDHRNYLAEKAELAAEAAGTDGADGTSSASVASAAETAASDEPSALEKKLTRIDGEYRQKLRVSAGWFFCGIAAAVLLLVLAAVPTYASFVRFYGEETFLDMIFRGVRQCLTVGDITPYTAAAASSPFGWFVSFCGALLYEGGGARVYALPNFLAAYAAAAAFLFCSVYLAMAARDHREEKGYRRALRAYIGLLLGMLTGLLPWAFAENVTAAQSGAFCLFYFSFIPLAFYIAENAVRDGEVRRKPVGAKRRVAATDVALIALFVLLFAVFVLCMPAVFGWEVSAAGDVMFGWMPPLLTLPSA